VKSPACCSPTTRALTRCLHCCLQCHTPAHTSRTQAGTYASTSCIQRTSSSTLLPSAGGWRTTVRALLHMAPFSCQVVCALQSAANDAWCALCIQRQANDDVLASPPWSLVTLFFHHSYTDPLSTPSHPALLPSRLFTDLAGLHLHYCLSLDVAWGLRQRASLRRSLLTNRD
jgi:hypothetical protein